MKYNILLCHATVLRRTVTTTNAGYDKIIVVEPSTFGDYEAVLWIDPYQSPVIWNVPINASMSTLMLQLQLCYTPRLCHHRERIAGSGRPRVS